MGRIVLEGERRWSRRRGIVVTATLVVVLGLVASVLKFRGGGEAIAQDGAGAGPGAMPPMPVDVDTARQRPVVDAVRATGRIEAVQAVELRPDEQGRITALLFREGQYVARGAPLIKIDDEMLRAQAERAKADRDLARQQLDRVRRLREQNASSPADLERAEAAARSAEAALAVLELQIARTTVRAPFAGVVGQRFVSAGDYVTTASRLLTLQTIDPQRAVIEVPERHAVRLRSGQTVEFTVAAEPGRTFHAQVDFIDPVVQEENRTIVVKARAPNRDRLLKPGMFIEARLATATRSNATVIPEDAVQPLRTANVVWAVADGKASRRVVQLGSRSQGVVEVLSGVEPGELVVVGGLERMADGMPLAPQPRGGAAAAEPNAEAAGQAVKN
ncbi:MAG TPA: efflux RND transporter periplasmic adaptor subunit [Gemmatimonadaceae bacterium]|nr:efflux RND transporter periplasmic adaptor subunit [Gemmatimonadaceae bacterium]